MLVITLSVIPGHLNTINGCFATCVFLSLLVISLGLIPCQLDSVHTVKSGFDTSIFIWDLVFIGWSVGNQAGTRRKIVQAGVRLYQA